ncbi:MAG: sugar nucleotide-binding protein [Planctomycetaceae bacterium]
MRHVAIIGSDTVVGHALATQLEKSCRITSQTLRPGSLPGAGASGIGPHDSGYFEAGADCVVFCGEASRSSWDPEFGDLSTDEHHIPSCASAAAESGIPLIFISSDAVFRGPWMFHDESCDAFDGTRVAVRLLELERCVLSAGSNLVVRTNAIGSTGHGDTFLDSIVDAALTLQPCELNSTTWSTPISAALLAAMFPKLLKHRLTGLLHLSGAERVSPWSFAGHLAAEMGSHRSLFPPATDAIHRTERSLHCARARQDLSLRMPAMKQTLDALVDCMQIGLPELIAA